jgi:polyferredoxin
VATARRQVWRWRILLGALVLFPVVFNYLSPYLILDASSRGIINGSFLVFSVLALSAFVVGRAWCGWLCPAGALGEVWAKAKGRPARGGLRNATKWAIWVPWIGLIVFLAVAAGGYHAVNPLYNTEHGVSVSSLPSLVIFCGVLLLISVFSLATGRRGFCHYACWMAPFLILGRKVEQAARWPALHLESQPETCIHCGACTKACPMSLDVRGMVEKGRMENAECILCGTCVDTCPKHVIRYAWRRTRSSPAR